MKNHPIILFLFCCFDVPHISAQYHKPLWTIKAERETIAPSNKDWAITLSIGLNARWNHTIVLNYNFEF